MVPNATEPTPAKRASDRSRSLAICVSPTAQHSKREGPAADGRETPHACQDLRAIQTKNCPRQTKPDKIRNKGKMRRSNAEILLAITDLIAGGDALPELFRQFAPLLRELTKSALVSFALYDTAQNRMVNRFREMETEIGLWNIVAREVARRLGMGEPATTDHSRLEQETRFAGTVSKLRNSGVGSYTVLPMSTQHAVTGRWASEERIYMRRSRDDFLERVVRLLALAVENRQIQQEWQEQQNRLQSLAAISPRTRVPPSNWRSLSRLSSQGCDQITNSRSCAFGAFGSGRAYPPNPGGGSS